MSEPAARDFDTYAEYRQALHEVLSRARHSVALFDPDLHHTDLESESGIGILKTLCVAANREDAVRILVHSPVFVERDCPRLQALLFRFRHRMSVRITTAGFRTWSQPLCVVDASHVVTRFHQDGPRGRLGLADSSEAAALLAQFDTTWISGRNGPNGAPLGI